jgi:urea transport system permease protein
MGRRPLTKVSHERATRLRWAGAIVLTAVVLGVYPFWASYYGLTLVRDALLFATFALSLDFFWGKAGLPSFGHAAHFGFGAYAYALVCRHVDPSYGPLLGLLAALALNACAGLLLGAFLLLAGVRGALFLVVTVAMTQICFQVVTSWTNVTGGENGLVGVPFLGFSMFAHSFALATPRSQYFFSCFVAVGTLFALWYACSGRFGRILRAICDDETRALTLGIDAPRVLTLAWAISAMIAGGVGAVYASMAGVVEPALIGPAFSVEVAVWVLVGGPGTLVGPFVGAIVIWRLSQTLSRFDPRLWQLAIGALFIGLVFLFPGGLASIFPRVRSLALTKWIARRNA